MCRPHPLPRGAALAGALIAAGCGVDTVVVAADVRSAAEGVVGDALNHTEMDFWDFMSQQMAGLAPPPSLVKCVGATIAGSAFALLGMVFEGQRKKEKLSNGAKESPKKLASKGPNEGQARTPSPTTTPDRAVRRTATGNSSQGGNQAEGGSSGSRPTSGGWRPSREVSEVEKTVRSVKSILNKLTRDKFDTLYSQLFACLESKEMRPTLIEAIAQEVFAKATVQHNFIEMYADLCAKLHVDLEKMATQEVSFKRALLDQCQHSFSVHLEPPRIDDGLDYDEQYEALVKYKTKMLGNVRFIGNLLRLRMLSPKIIFNCTEELLNIGTPEALETLCAFLETLGAAFDTREWQGRQKLDEVFTRIELLAADPRQIPRTKCLLKDLLDKRGNHWRQWPTTQERTSFGGSPPHSGTPIGGSPWRQAGGDSAAGASPIGAATSGRSYRPRESSDACGAGGVRPENDWGLIRRNVSGPTGPSVGCRTPLGGTPPSARPYARTTSIER